MPTNTAEVQLLLVWVAAGFIAARVRDVVCPGRERTDLERTVTSITHSALVVWILDIVLKVAKIGDADTWLSTFSGHTVLALFVIAVVEGYAYGKLLKWEAFQSLLGRLGIQNRTSATVWNEAMCIGHKETNRWVQVVMQDGTRYLGWMNKVSINVDGHRRELLLKDVVLVAPNGESQCELDSVYVEGSSIVAVEFLHGHAISCDPKK